MKTQKLLIAFIICSLSLFTIKAQSTMDCLDLVKAVYKKMNQDFNSKLNENVDYKINCSVKTIMRNKSIAPMEVNIEMNFQEGRFQYLSGPVKIYQDQRDRITVLSDQKIIYIEGAVKANKHQKIQKLLQFQDTLFSMCQVSSCHSIGGDKVVSVEMNERGREFSKINAATFSFGIENMKLKKLSVNYIKENQIENVEIVFERIEFNCHTMELEANVNSLFFDHQNKMLPFYQGYKLVDYRKN